MLLPDGDSPAPVSDRYLSAAVCILSAFCSAGLELEDTEAKALLQLGSLAHIASSSVRDIVQHTHISADRCECGLSPVLSVVSLQWSTLRVQTQLWQFTLFAHRASHIVRFFNEY